MTRTASASERPVPGASLPGTVDNNYHPASQQKPKRHRQVNSARSISSTLMFAKRQAIFEEQQPADAIYQVISGAVVLTRAVTGGRRQVLEVVAPGGLLGVVPGTHYGCRAETMTRTALRRIDRGTAEVSVALQRVIAQALMQKLEKMHAETAMRTRKSAAECVAALILTLPRAEDEATRTGAASKDCRLALSQTDMASYLGLAIETVCRVIRDLKRTGAIQLSGRDRITILDERALARLATTSHDSGCAA